MTERLWKTANGVMLLTFVFSAAVQANDPDPHAWMAVYGAAALVCGLEIWRRTPVVVPAVLALVSLVWAASLYSRAHDVPVSAMVAAWEMRDLRIEEAREMYGLAIVGIWMLMILGVRWARARGEVASAGVRAASHTTRRDAERR